VTLKRAAPTPVRVASTPHTLPGDWSRAEDKAFFLVLSFESLLMLSILIPLFVLSVPFFWFPSPFRSSLAHSFSSLLTYPSHVFVVILILFSLRFSAFQFVLFVIVFLLSFPSHSDPFDALILIPLSCSLCVSFRAFIRSHLIAFVRPS